MNSVLDRNDRAFKEWAVVVRAMERGETVLLIRKGGITEEGGAFRMEDPEFFLFPNHTHQNAAQLQARAHALLDESDADAPDAGTVRISSYAEAAHVFTIPTLDVLARLDPEHLWSRAYVTERFQFKPQNPLYGIVLRVFRLPEPVTLPYRNSYGGCTSWITLEAPLSTSGATPALNDAAFAERLERIHGLLAGEGNTLT